MKLKLIIFNVLFFSLSTSAQDKIDVFFDFNKYDLNPVALIKLSDWILKHPDRKILKIYGFCDWKGTNKYNETLSLQRVQTVLDYLTVHNVQIDNDYIQKGFGKNFTQDVNQALNRKVQIEFSISIPETIDEIIPKEINEIQEITLSEQVSIAKVGDNIKLKNINFFNNSARIVPKSRSALRDLLSIMQNNPNLKIEIQGHLCCQFSNRMKHVSTDRALAVYDFLVKNKIKSNRLKYKGYGVKKPIHPIPEKSPTQEAENRRVEIKILQN